MKEGAPSNEVCINFKLTITILYSFIIVNYIHDNLFSSEVIIGSPYLETCASAGVGIQAHVKATAREMKDHLCHYAHSVYHISLALYEATILKALMLCITMVILT